MYHCFHCASPINGTANYVQENGEFFCSHVCLSLCTGQPSGLKIVNDDDDEDMSEGNEVPFLDDEPIDFADDAMADADALANIGWGTDEDYGVFDGYDGMDYDFSMHDD